jgi:hypothetical protein
MPGQLRSCHGFGNGPSDRQSPHRPHLRSASGRLHAPQRPTSRHHRIPRLDRTHMEPEDRPSDRKTPHRPHQHGIFSLAPSSTGSRSPSARPTMATYVSGAWKHAPARRFPSLLLQQALLSLEEEVTWSWPSIGMSMFSCGSSRIARAGLDHPLKIRSPPLVEGVPDPGAGAKQPPGVSSRCLTE